MAKTPKLDDLQLVLLSTANQRDDGSVLPPADSIATEEKRIRAAIPQLLKRGLIDEVPIKERRFAWREEAEQPIGVAITDAGRAIIAPEAADVQTSPNTKPSKKKGAPAVRNSKATTVLNLLQRSQGATLSELADATGWLPHTTRAALTGLRKKGHVLKKSKREDATCYHVAEVA